MAQQITKLPDDALLRKREAPERRLDTRPEERDIPVRTAQHTIHLRQTRPHQNHGRRHHHERGCLTK